MQQVSVIIPTYNRAAYIVAALHSVFDQTFSDYEVIIVDDGSTDETESLLASFLDRVRYFRLPHCGLSAAVRNHGLTHATGEFIAFLDSDDLFRPNKLALQVAALRELPDVGVVYSNGSFFQGEVTNITGHVLDGLAHPSGMVFEELLRGNFLFLQTSLFRKSALDAVGKFNENPQFKTGQDYELFLRLAAQYPFHYLSADVAAIRRHEGSITRNFLASKLRLLDILRAAKQNFPDLTQQYRNAYNEHVTKTHGAVALTYLREGQLFAALPHFFAGLSHGKRIPRQISKSGVRWWKNRRLRKAAR